MATVIQTSLFEEAAQQSVQPFTTQLLKWVGNKQRFAHKIASLMPRDFGTYHEPFLGSGAVLSTLSPRKAIGSDTFKPLIDIFTTLKDSPETLKEWYATRWEEAHGEQKRTGYERIREAYNLNPNGADLLFLCRACYGGVVRFRKLDGYMSTPCGAHEPITPQSFSKRVDIWHERVAGATFLNLDYKEAMRRARKNDLIYCDPPYVHSQAILYGGHEFRFEELVEEIDRCKSRGVKVALSIDGLKKSGKHICELPIPEKLFEEEIYLNLGRSMLKRFQMKGATLEEEVVSDRLYLTYKP